jgi:hypothetical protein
MIKIRLRQDLEDDAEKFFSDRNITLNDDAHATPLPGSVVFAYGDQNLEVLELLEILTGKETKPTNRYFFDDADRELAMLFKLTFA